MELFDISNFKKNELKQCVIANYIRCVIYTGTVLIKLQLTIGYDDPTRIKSKLFILKFFFGNYSQKSISS